MEVSELLIVTYQPPAREGQLERTRQEALRPRGTILHVGARRVAQLESRPDDLESRLQVSYGQGTPDAGASTLSTWPARGPFNMFSGPLHSFAIMNSVLRSAPPSAQAKHPRSSSILCSTSPPSRTRTHCSLGTSAYQTAPWASRHMPSGTPSPRSAQTRRFDRQPSSSMSKANSLLA